MLCTAPLAHPPYLQPELTGFVQHYDGPWRWENWLEDRQRLQRFGWYPATCREEHVWRVIPRLTATYVRQAASEVEA
jgi:hypothetical protein